MGTVVSLRVGCLRVFSVSDGEQTGTHDLSKVWCSPTGIAASQQPTESVPPTPASGLAVSNQDLAAHSPPARPCPRRPSQSDSDVDSELSRRLRSRFERRDRFEGAEGAMVLAESGQEENQPNPELVQLVGRAVGTREVEGWAS